jgi:hypothetical protein
MKIVSYKKQINSEFEPELEITMVLTLEAVQQLLMIGSDEATHIIGAGLFEQLNKIDLT